MFVETRRLTAKGNDDDDDEEEELPQNKAPIAIVRDDITSQLPFAFIIMCAQISSSLASVYAPYKCL